jgi:hypothetical protein
MEAVAVHGLLLHQYRVQYKVASTGYVAALQRRIAAAKSRQLLTGALETATYTLQAAACC